MKRIMLFLLALAAALLLCAAALADTAQDVTASAQITVPQNGGTLGRMLDRDRSTALQAEKSREPVIEVSMQDGQVCSAVYIEFGNNIMPFTVQIDYNGEWVDLASWNQPYAQAYVQFEPLTQFRLRFDTGDKPLQLFIRELYLFGQGERDDSLVNIWESSVQKADLLVLAGHPGDELQWFGGLVPYYAVGKGYSVAVATMTMVNSCRRLEMLNAMHACGLHSYPDIGMFEDLKTTQASKAFSQWGGIEATDRYVVQLLRRYQPEVVVTHAIEGEDGHGVHMACARSLLRAVKKAADVNYDPASASMYGAWQVKKLYLHEGDSPIRISWSTPLESLAGKTAYQVAWEAYQKYETTTAGAMVGESAKHSPCLYTLAYTAVGEDKAGNDLFENIPESDLTTAQP